MHSAPFIVSWDDHEVDNDYAGIVDENDTPPEVFLLRRAAAYQAYFEHMPLRAASMPDGPRLQLYRRLTFGSLIDFNVLDTRQYRIDQACGHGAATNCAAAGDPARSILGAAQERGCSSSLRTARARWTVLGQQVPMFARDNGPAVDPDARFSMDKWDGYSASRQRVFARLRRDAGRQPDRAVRRRARALRRGPEDEFRRSEKSATVGVEFTNSSITSGGDGSDGRAGVGTAAAAQPAPPVPQQSPWLRRLHRDDGDDARGVQDRRSRQRAGRAPATPPARWSSRPAARAARATRPWTARRPVTLARS